MAQAIATAIVVAVAEVVGGPEAALAAAEFMAEYGAAVVTVAQISAAVYVTSSQQKSAAQSAKDVHNAALRDRYTMVRGATEPRQMVLGRARVSGPLTFIGSYGPNREHLIFALVLAAHEIDAVETIYFDNHPVLIDANGNVYGVQQKETFSISGVLAAPSNTFTLSSPPQAATVAAQAVYGTTIVALTATVNGSTVTLSGGQSGQTGLIEIRYQPNPCPFVNSTVTNITDTFPSASISGTFTLSQTPIAGSASAIFTAGSGVDSTNFIADSISISGNSATVSGASSGLTSAPLTIQYQTLPVVSSKARIKVYTGAAGQTADPDMIAAFPALWTSAHVGNGLAYLRIEFDYDPTAFPGGLPNVSAIVRGAKVYDPRNGTTAWSDNAALLLRYAATSPLCGRLDPALISDASIIVAANVCDTSTNYVVGGQTYTRKLFAAGMSAKTTLRPQDVLNDLAQAMAGKWAFIDGLLRVKAGSFTTPVRTLDESWLHEAQQIHIQPKHARIDVFNVVTGVFADASLDYQISPMPRIAPAAYIAEDGVELPHDLTLSAVQFTGQAQHIAGCTLREARAGLTMTALCNYRAYEIEVFDIINVSLSRFGWVNKTFEVMSVDWSLTGGIQLALKAVDATIMQLDAAFTAFNPATATRLPSPWVIAQVTGLNALSGTAQLLKQSDGTIVSRVLVGWTAITDQAVLAGGKVEVRYGLATTPQPLWSSVMAQGSDTQVYLPQTVRDLSVYIIQARASNSFTSGQWSLPILCQVIGKTARPSDVAGFAATPAQAGVPFIWVRPTDVDYGKTLLRLGTPWATAKQIFAGDATGWTWTSAPAGTYTVLAKHIDTTGNESLTAASVTVTVTADMVLARANAAFDAAATAGGQLSALLDDDVLSPSEKPSLVALYTNILNEQSGIDAQALAFGVSSAAYDAAINQLTSYLSGAPGWNVIPGVNVGLQGTVCRAWFQAVYTARQALLNATAAAAGTITAWRSSGVVGSGQLCANGDFSLSTNGIPNGFGVYNNAGISVSNTVAIDGASGINYWRIQANSAVTNVFGFYFLSASASFGGWQANTNCIVSFYARISSNPSGNNILPNWNYSPNSITILQNPILSSVFQRYVFLINFGSNKLEPNGFFYLSNQSAPSGVQLDFSRVMFENGDAPSGWSSNQFSALNGPNGINQTVTYLDAAGVFTGNTA